MSLLLIWNRVYNILERDIIESLMRSEGGDQRRSHVNKVLGVVFVPWRNNSYNAMNMANWQYHDQYAMPTTIDHIHQNMGENDNLTNLVCDIYINKAKRYAASAQLYHDYTKTTSHISSSCISACKIWCQSILTLTSSE